MNLRGEIFCTLWVLPRVKNCFKIMTSVFDLVIIGIFTDIDPKIYLIKIVVQIGYILGMLVVDYRSFQVLLALHNVKKKS